MNGEGYKDPTADKAIRDYNRMPYRIKQVLLAMNSVASLHGLEIIAVRDKQTGKIWGR